MNASFLKRVMNFWNTPEAPKRAEFLLCFVKALQKSDLAAKEVKNGKLVKASKAPAPPFEKRCCSDRRGTTNEVI